jgi:hypothetical protein
MDGGVCSMLQLLLTFEGNNAFQFELFIFWVKDNEPFVGQLKLSSETRTSL